MSIDSALSAPPRRLINADGVLERHGRERLALLAGGLRTGDPVADAVIAEFAERGATARAALRTGLADGLAAVTDPPPAVAALLAESERSIAGADPGLLERGDVPSITVDPFWSRIGFALASLVHTYSAPGIARVLTGTGRLTGGAAARRLGETGLWRANAVAPGGLLRGAPGYQDSVQVRLLHARVRARALEGGWDTGAWGVPINQVDTARTWLDFTVVPFRALERVGIHLSEEEERDLYRYWHHVAALIGVDPRFYRDVHDHASAAALLELIDATNAAPDDAARSLVGALLEALAGPMEESLSLPRATADALLAALTRLMQGEEAADALGIERVDVAPFLPLLAMGNAGVRRWQRATPESWRLALAEQVEYRRTEFAGLPGTEYRDHAAGTV
ncbi:oxygenase MpaB family protein [Nocardiopsis sediminis]|uniref:Oxygenase MpaB family protein n=1 Tax=Nocardiopsis sediminis TaxID=1778267 RepID=A0ABV8FRN1_9ACTN